MSRTTKDIPYKIWKTKVPKWKYVRFPAMHGGAWPKRKSWARIRNKQYRRKIKQIIPLTDELPKYKKGIKWDIW